IREAGHYNNSSFADHFAKWNCRQQCIESDQEQLHCGPDSFARNRPVIFFGKIDIVSDERLERDQLIPKCSNSSRESAIQLCESCSMHQVRSCVDEITYCFRLGDIELSI